MTKYKYDYRRVYRQMLKEEAEVVNENAPIGGMTSTGANSAYGNTGDGTSSTINQTMGVGSAKIAKPLTLCVNKRKFDEMMDSSCTKKESVNEACENCQCEKCSAERKGEIVENSCVKHLKEFFGEAFEITEYTDEGASALELEENYMISISKKGDDQPQDETQPQQPTTCQKCNAQPCKCNQEPVQGTGDPNLQGQIQQ